MTMEPTYATVRVRTDEETLTILGRRSIIGDLRVGAVVEIDYTAMVILEIAEADQEEVLRWAVEVREATEAERTESLAWAALKTMKALQKGEAPMAAGKQAMRDINAYLSQLAGRRRGKSIDAEDGE